MKKLLSLLSVLTISGGAVPTTIAASPYQKEETIKNSDINYQQINNFKSLRRNKRDFYEKEKIEFFNNDFFYKFSIKYNEEKRTDGAFSIDSSILTFDKITLIKDWTKYANSWEEFSTKFPEIELINFKSIIKDKNNTKEVFKIKNIKNKNLEWSQKDISNFFSNYYLNDYGNDWNKNANEIDNNINEFNSLKENPGACERRGKILFRLYVDQKELKAQVFYNLRTSNCFDSYIGSVKFDSIRLVGEVDINPLFSLTVEKSKLFDDWAKSEEKALKLKREDKNYNQNTLLSEEEAFKNEFKLWLSQIKHSYIQDLINIDQNNEIIGLKSEIDNIKTRLDRLEKTKTCLDNIFDAFKRNALSDATGDAWKSIKDNSESPLKIIIKKSGNAFAGGLLTGIAKSSALSIVSCVADSLI